MSKRFQKASPTPISKSTLVKNSNISKDPKPKIKKSNNIKDFSEDSDFFEDFTPYQRTGRIIHQSTEQSYDDKGNKVTKTKIVREIEDSSNSKQNYKEIKISNNKRKNKIETKNKKDRFSSPDFQASPITYESPPFFDDKKEDNIEEMGYKTNYVYESRKINGKNIGEYSTKEKYEYVNRNGNKESRYEKSIEGSPKVAEIISPVHYVDNSSGSDFDENQIKSFDNYHYSIKTNNTNINNQKKNKIKLNYELEDPEGFDYLSKNERKVSNEDLKSSSRYINRSKIRNKVDDLSKSDLRDFQSPDKNSEAKRNFRKVNVGMIESKGPSNDDRKVNNIITKEVIQTSSYKDRRTYKDSNIYTQNYNENNYYYTEDENVRIRAAKIIQGWWRTRFNHEQEEEVYNLTMKSAIKLQSFIRGFLVRKKVLRYITLAIYYQSFCDKLQDVLCNYIKKEIFQLFKNRYLHKAKSIKRIKKEDIIKRKNILISIIKRKKEYYYSQVLKYLLKWKRISEKLKSSIRVKEGYKSVKTTANSKIIFNTTNKSSMTYIDRKVVTQNIKSPSRIKKESENNVNKISTITNTYRKKNEESTSKYSRRNKNIEKYSSNTSKITNTTKTIKNVTYDKNVKDYENRDNFKYFSRVEKSQSKLRDDDRGVSPKFGVLRKTVSSTNTNITDNKELNKTANIITVKNRSTLTDIKTQKKEKEKEKRAKTPLRIINSRSPSRITTTKTRSNTTTNYYKSTETIDKSRKIEESEDVIRREYNFFPENTIDNQMAISIVKLPDNNLNKSMELPQKIKLKERIIIQKEAKPETAEEGNNMQIFDMEVSKRVSMYIEPAMEFRKIIRDEQKELEIFRKREREKNKELDRYKDDIERRKKKNKIDALKSSILIVESFKKRILQKKFHQFVNYRPIILEVQPTYDIQITHKPKQKRDFSVQITPKKERKKFDVLKVGNIRPISIEQKKVERPQKVTRIKFDIISKIPKKEQGLQSEPWDVEIESMDDFNIIDQHKPRGELIIGETNSIAIQQDHPEMVDDEIQHEYEENFIENESLQIDGIKPECVEMQTQYEQYKPKITKENLRIIGEKKPEKKVEKRDMECNTNIITVDEGLDALNLEEPKPKNIEVKLRTVKRSLYKMEIPILKRLWLRKAFRTFKENCQRPPFHLIMLTELMRMYLLRWRFKKGYGPDRYGNAYDRDGNLLYRTRGLVADSEIQNELSPELDEQGTQYVPIENIISKLKEIEIGPAYKKEKKIMKEKSVGSDIRLDERIIKAESINIKTKVKKKENKVTKSNFVIKKEEKKIKDAETQINKEENEIEKMDEFHIDDTEHARKSKLKELIRKMTYKKLISEKLILSEALRNWLKYTLITIHDEEIEMDYLRRTNAEIKENSRFTIGENIQKSEAGTQMSVKKNKIESQLNLNLINKIKKKNAEINVNIPHQFDQEKLKPKLQNKLKIESTKKPVVLKRQKENMMNIFSEDYLFREEVKKGIHHKMSEQAKKRVKEILYNFLMTRGDPLTILRKYFTIYERKANYLSLLENARIISEFCKRNLERMKTYKKWERISKKLIIKERIKIIKYSKILYTRLSKIFNLIRITRLHSIYSKRKYLHYIIIAWLAYTKTMIQKRSHVKILYENMLSTYMNMADDVFGPNQKENPSVQDALYEAVDSNKFQTKEVSDVPLAMEYYENKKDRAKFNQSFSKIFSEENKSFEESKTNRSNTSNSNIAPNNIFFKSINEIKNKNKNETKYEVKTGIGFKNVITNRPIQEKIIIVKDEEKLKSKGRGRAFRTSSEREIINNYSSNIKNYKKEGINYENDESGSNINNMSIKIEERKKNDEFDDLDDDKNESLDKNRMSYRERRNLFKSKLYENKK